MTNPPWESVSTQAIIRGVHNNLGVSVLPEELVKEDINRGYVKTAAITDADFYRDFWICYHKNKFLSESMKQIIRILNRTK